MTENLTSKTLHGLKWSYTGTIINSILQIGFTAIMARLLEPADFGLMAKRGSSFRFVIPGPLPTGFSLSPKSNTVGLP
jgi:hypothetical protein